MKKKRIIDLIFVILTALSLSLTLIFFNHDEEAVSKSESRKLAPKPTSPVTSQEYRTELTDYIDDNIGLRDPLLQLRTALSLKLYGSIPSEKIVAGKDGFYFYNADHNLEITTGGYPMTDEMLAEIAEAQQTVSDHYKDLGIDYVLALTPSKASVYPEYMSGDYTVGTTVIDTVYEYLKEHTDVTVVNAKDNVIAHKGDGQLFWHNDTHFTQLGAYYAYQAIVQTMEDAGICSIRDFTIDRSGTESITGEFSRMLGIDGILGTETADDITWDRNSVIEKDTDYVANLKDISVKGGMNANYSVDVYKNSDTSLPRLLIYGDSQFMAMRKIPAYLAESCSEVVMTRLRTFSTDIEKIVQPDVVMFTMTERYLETLQRYCPFTRPAAETTLPDLPHTENPIKLFLDYYNGQKPEVSGTVKVDTSLSTASIEGWAADFENVTTLADMYLYVGGKYYKAAYGNERAGVVSYYNEPKYLKSGYRITIRTSCFKNEDGTNADFMQLIGVSPEGYFYRPVTFKLTY